MSLYSWFSKTNKNSPNNVDPLSAQHDQAMWPIAQVKKTKKNKVITIQKSKPLLLPLKKTVKIGQ